MTTCITCEKVFKQKIEYTRHLKRKFPCQPPVKNKEIVTDTMMNKVDMIIKTNELLVKSNDKLVKLNDKLNGEMKKMKKDISILKKKCNNNNIINNIAHANININLMSYGKDEFKKIDTCEFLSCCKQGFKTAVHLTETVHFNPKYPEYHNIYISNMKNTYAMVYKNNNWETVIKCELIDDIYDNCKNYIEENLEGFYEKLTKSQQQSLQRWIKTHDENENDDKIKKIKKELHLLLFNKKNMVIKNK